MRSMDLYDMTYGVLALCIGYAIIEIFKAPPSPHTAHMSKAELRNTNIVIIILLFLFSVFLMSFWVYCVEYLGLAKEALAPMPSDGLMLEALKFAKFIETPEQRRALYELLKAYFIISWGSCVECLAREARAPMPSDGLMLEALNAVKFIETPEQRRALYELLETFPGLVAATAEWEL